YTYIISIDGSKFTCTTCIVYQFFKERFFSIVLRFKSGCKGKRFILKYQMFLEVFFKCFPGLFSGSLSERERHRNKRLLSRIGLQR
ncbi:hypothetical protein O1364_19160, partial [Bacteroides fragilis]|uniref:hypothetical protein n=1 Tax=Bacteroides fragilis TaxID=817 RepID=UPI0022CA461A